MTTVQPGRYRHFKCNEYTVVGVAFHSETQEELVVYRQEYGDHGLWVRPKQMFLETVAVDAKAVPRFRYVGGKNEPRSLTQAQDVRDDLGNGGSLHQCGQ